MNSSGYVDITKAEGGFGKVYNINNLDSLVEKFLVDIFVFNRLVLIGDDKENFIYGLTKEGFKRPQDLFSSVHPISHQITQSYFTSSVSFYLQRGLTLNGVTNSMNDVWFDIWSDNIAINSQGDIWYNFWFYKKLFETYWS